MYEIIHTVTGHTYKSGFEYEAEARVNLNKHRAHLRKYLPVDCSTGTFEVRPQI